MLRKKLLEHVTSKRGVKVCPRLLTPSAAHEGRRYILALSALSLWCVCGVALPASAHDFWIEPSTFRPQPGSVIKVALRVGEDFKGEPVRRESEKIERFLLASSAGTAPIKGMEGADPAGLVRVDSPGLHTIVYRSTRSSIELPAEKFEAYLKEEGLERIVALRAARGESAKAGREVYSRCAKAIVLCGDPPVSPLMKGGGDFPFGLAPRSPSATLGKGSDPPQSPLVKGGGDLSAFLARGGEIIGLPLELVAEANPYALSPGGSFAVRVLFENQPLPGVLVTLISREEPQRTQSARSDDNGRVAFTLPPSGVVLIKTVHMTEAPPEVDADWESFWASMTFEVPSSPTASR